MKIKRPSSLWVGVCLGFGLLLTAWSVLLYVARQNPVATVPLEHQVEGGAK